MQHRSHLLIITAAAIAVRLSILAFITPGTAVWSDMGNYDHVATDLATGSAYSFHTFFPIGYPAFLAAIYATVGRSFLVVGILQAVLGGLTIPLAWSLAHRFGASPTQALLPALVVALYPPFVYYGVMLLTEALAPCFVTLAIWLFIRAVDRPSDLKAIGVAGMALAIATLVRTNILIVYPFLLLVAWVGVRHNAGAALRVTCGVFICALPLLAASSLQNSRLLGRPAGLSSNGGMNFFMLQADYRTFEALDGQWTPLRNFFKYKDTYYSPVLTTDERALYREGVSAFVSRPDKLRHVFSNLGEGLGLGLQGYWPANRLPAEDPSERTLARRLLRLSSQAYFWVLVLPTAVFAILALTRRELFHAQNVGLVVALSLLMATLITSAVFLADPRMHVPFDAVLISYGLTALLTVRSSGHGSGEMARNKSRRLS